MLGCEGTPFGMAHAMRDGIYRTQVRTLGGAVIGQWVPLHQV